MARKPSLHSRYISDNSYDMNGCCSSSSLIVRRLSKSNPRASAVLSDELNAGHLQGALDHVHRCRARLRAAPLKLSDGNNADASLGRKCLL
jgi:hypothetical protein